MEEVLLRVDNVHRLRINVGTEQTEDLNWKLIQAEKKQRYKTGNE
jgi:hypothetical protein